MFTEILLLETACKTSLSLLNIILYLYHFRIDVNGIIKVGDFGLSEDIYLHNYFRQWKRDDSDSTAVIKVPVKWMALESLHDGLFSEKTDVVSTLFICHVQRYYSIQSHSGHMVCYVGRYSVLVKLLILD